MPRDEHLGGIIWTNVLRSHLVDCVRDHITSDFASYSYLLHYTYTTNYCKPAREQRVRNTLAKRQVLLSLAGVLYPSFQHAKGLVVRSRMVLPRTMPIISIPSSEESQCKLQYLSSNENLIGETACIVVLGPTGAILPNGPPLPNVSIQPHCIYETVRIGGLTHTLLLVMCTRFLA